MRLARSREWWAANANDPDHRERRRQYMREYNQKNKEVLAEKRRADSVARRERDRLYRNNNPDKIREGKRRWRLSNREAVAAYDREWRASNPEKVQAQRKRYYWSNRDKHVEKQAARHAAGYYREWRRANSETVLVSQRASRLRNREKILARSRAYWSQNRDKFADYKRTRETKRTLAKALGIPIDSVPTPILEAKLAQLRVLRKIKAVKKSVPNIAY